jgi:hypothetical protein
MFVLRSGDEVGVVPSCLTPEVQTSAGGSLPRNERSAASAYAEAWIVIKHSTSKGILSFIISQTILSSNKF